MKKQKKFTTKVMRDPLLVIPILLFIALLFYTYIYLPPSPCSSNPEKCVCEEQLKGFWKNETIGEIKKDTAYKENKCRLKTHSKTDWEMHPEDYVAEVNEIETDEIDYSQMQDVIQSKEFQSYYISKMVDRNLIPSNRCAKTNQLTFKDGNVSVTREVCTWIHPKKKINQTTYRLKNECGKGTEGWIEEEGCVYDESTLNMDKEEIEWIKKYAQSKNIPLCTSIQAICREKTEVEKLIDKDCKFLQNELFGVRIKDYRNCPDNPPLIGRKGWLNNCQYLKDVSEAWRQKECKI